MLKLKPLFFSILLIRFGFKRRESLFSSLSSSSSLFFASIELFSSASCVCVFEVAFLVYVVSCGCCVLFLIPWSAPFAISSMLPRRNLYIIVDNSKSAAQLQQLKDISNTWQPLANSLYGHVMRSFTLWLLSLLTKYSISIAFYICICMCDKQAGWLAGRQSSGIHTFIQIYDRNFIYNWNTRRLYHR